MTAETQTNPVKVMEQMDGNERRQYIISMFLTEKINVDPDAVYKPRPGDVIIVGAMKTGTTWLQQIVHQLRTKGDESFRDIYDVTWYLNNKGNNVGFNVNSEQVCNPRIYKHHEDYGVIPASDKQKTIIITRNPYDAAYSYTKFINRWFGGHSDIADEEMADMLNLLHKTKKMGNFSCTGTWWAHRNDLNHMFLFYEDFHEDLKFMIRKIADFVEIPLTDEELQNIILPKCTFEYMVKHKDLFRGDQVIDAWNKYLNVAKWTPNMGMVREDGGRIGQGVKQIGPKLKKTVNKLWHETITVPYGFKEYKDMYTKNSLFKKPISQL